MPKSVQVRWKPHGRLSVYHAAWTVSAGTPCVDAATHAVIADTVAKLNTRLYSQSIDVAEFWQHLLAHVSDERDTPPTAKSEIAACERALLDAGVSEFSVEPIAMAAGHWMTQCRLAIQSRFPKLCEQLELRGRPLRDRWETYGNGLLRLTAAHIWDGAPPQDWWPKRVDGLLVNPIAGGGGGYAGQDRIWIEAVLTDNEPTVPEVVRIAYLITRLAVSTHLRGLTGGTTGPLPWNLACVPIVLSAAAELELVDASNLPIAAAIGRWDVGPASLAPVLQRWWAQRRHGSTSLPVALKALARMTQTDGQSPAADAGRGTPTAADDPDDDWLRRHDRDDV